MHPSSWGGGGHALSIQSLCWEKVIRESRQVPVHMPLAEEGLIPGTISIGDNGKVKESECGGETFQADYEEAKSLPVKFSEAKRAKKF